MLDTQQTRDFYLAAYLVASGIKLQSHNRYDGSTVFYFTNDNCTQEAMNTYYNMNGMVEPITYANSIKALKSIVHSYDKANTNSEGKYNVKQYRDNN